MVAVTKKRKRQDPPGERSDTPSDPEISGIQDLFRVHFESKFKPLEPVQKHRQEESSNALEEVNAGSDWSGLSSGPEEDEVEVVEDSITQLPDQTRTSESRKFMSSKPPDSKHKLSNKSKDPRQDSEDEAREKLNLKNDLALQRLISESHLLGKAKSGSRSGHRERVTDQRIRALGSKSSILAQEKMPFSHRKGITAKTREREDRRRQEAKENGIILEKPDRGNKVATTTSKRMRGVGGPSVGKLNSATLTLSRRDIAGIQGTSNGTARRSVHR